MRGTVAKRLRRLAAQHSQDLPHTEYETIFGQKTIYGGSALMPTAHTFLTRRRINSINSYRGRYLAIKQAHKRGTFSHGR